MWGTKKIKSCVIVISMITGGFLMAVPVSMPNVAAYMTPPGSSWTWDQMMFDADMSTGGTAVTYIGPYNYLVHEDIIIDPTSTIRTEGPEFTQMDMLMGIRIVVEGVLDANLGGTFVGWSAPGDWEGFVVQNGGQAMFSGMTNPLVISDAMNGIIDDNTLMMGTNIMVNNGLIDNCAMSGITILEDMGNPMIADNTITNCGIGIYLQGNTDAMIMGNHINNNMMHGIHLLSVTNAVMMDSNTISDNFMGSGIFLEDSFAFIMNNWIYGWNATPSSFQPGGPAIHLTGNPQWTTTISWNNIVGGSGDEYGIAGLAPDGGHGIWLDNLEGMAPGSQVVIDNNPLIRGGEGGPNIFNDGLAGAGGDAIRVDGIPDIGDPFFNNEALRITNNGQILGGHGADNNCPQNGVAGDGGYGIHIIDDDFTGSQEISGNAFILAGNGGHNFADDTAGGSNWHCGDGGDGIYIQDAWTGVFTELLHNLHVEGGKGGNGTANGQFKKTGKGGDGIHLRACMNATIDPTIAFGGDGGDNTGNMILAGDGGDGILIDAFAARFSVVMIFDVNGTGGEGGDNYMTGGPGGGGAGTGGDGLEVDGSFVFSTNSNYTGGKGGDTYADMDFGGMGGYGAHLWNASGFTAIIGSIYGGDGGDSRYNGPPGGGSWGGMGSSGVYAVDAGTNLDIQNHLMIMGGNGGDLWFDTVGDAGFGGLGIQSSNAGMFSVVGSNVTVGAGGFNWITGGNADKGNHGIWVTNAGGGATTSFNRVYGARTWGIHYFGSGGQIIGNEIFNNSSPGTGAGVHLWNSNPLIQGNNIHNNYIGIWIDSNSNPDIIKNDVYNSTYAGIYIKSGSSPFISRTTIDNSDQYGIRADDAPICLVENCTISNSGTFDWTLSSNSHLVSLNTTSDKTTFFFDAASTLTMDWFMHTQVVDQFFTPVAGAEVWINDTFGTNILNAFTPASGWINWTVVTEFIETQTARTYYTDHNATAIAGLQQGWATPEPNMDASREVIIVLGASVYNIFLNQGWNLISIPLIQADESIDQALRTIDGKWDKIMIYDALDPNPWKSNCTYWPSSLNEFDTLNRTQGFWIRITSPSATLTVTGNEPVTTNIPLYAGWNLVGYPSFLEKTISNALSGTGYDEPVQGWDPAAPYGLTQLADSYMMKPGEAYWVHVPADTIWVVDNPSVITDPYSIYGYVYLYDGTSAGGYTPLLSGAGSTIDVTWWDPLNGWQTLSTVTNAAGQYSVDLVNYTDGSEVYVNATFAGFGNNGYNYTYVDTIGFPGGRRQDVVCGVPYDIFIVNPIPFTPVPFGSLIPVDFVILDRDGMLAQGYYTFFDGPIDWVSSDPAWIPPFPVFFDGTASPTPGQWNDFVTFWSLGLQTIEIYEGGMPSNQYPTHWGQFFIDPFDTIPGWMKDWDLIIVDVF